VIIYVLHENIGHLGIFVSSSVAKKEHQEIASVTKMIESLAPGLYEMVITTEDGERRVAFEERKVEDIKALCGEEDDVAKFVSVARLSKVATDAYDMWLRPIVKTLVTPEMADSMLRLHPMRQQRYFFSDNNPAMTGVDEFARQARAERKPAEPGNPFVELEQLNAALIEQGWDFYRDLRDALFEMSFHAIYGSPWMRFISGTSRQTRRRRDPLRTPEVQDALERIDKGGYAEALIRMLVLMAHARGSVRRSRLERSNQILLSREPFATMPQEERARIIREQTLIVDYAAPGRAVNTLPALLPDPADRQRAIDLVLEVAGTAEEMDGPTASMFERLQAVIETRASGWKVPAASSSALPVPVTEEEQAPASTQKRRAAS